MHRWLILPLFVTSFQAQAFFFPELPFCPLGGPPGWFNRIVNDDYYRYPPPGYGYRPLPQQYYRFTPARPASACDERRPGLCPLR